MQGAIQSMKEEEKITSILQTKIKLRRMSEIYCELLKIKDGLVKYTCQVRNLLHAFGGEMEMYCKCVNPEIQSLINLLEEGLNPQNWEKANDLVIVLYERIFKCCNSI